MTSRQCTDCGLLSTSNSCRACGGKVIELRPPPANVPRVGTPPPPPAKMPPVAPPTEPIFKPAPTLPNPVAPPVVPPNKGRFWRRLRLLVVLLMVIAMLFVGWGKIVELSSPSTTPANQPPARASANDTSPRSADSNNSETTPRTCNTSRTDRSKPPLRLQPLPRGRDDYNSYVAELQRQLMSLGYHVEGGDDGLFGPNTERAVKQFQRNNGLDDDGRVGPYTWACLYDPNAARGD